MLDEDPYIHFAGLKPNDFHQTLLCDGERDISVEDVENWLEENNSDPSY